MVLLTFFNLKRFITDNEFISCSFFRVELLPSELYTVTVLFKDIYSGPQNGNHCKLPFCKVLLRYND